AEKIVDDLRKALVGKSVKRREIEKIVKETLENSLKEIMNIDAIDIVEKVKTKKPYVIIFVGFNGVGKTMSIAKLGNMLKANGLSVVFAAADTWRAAALEQLEVHGKNLGIKVIKQDYGSDPAAVIFDAVKHAKAKDIDVVLADTAGRSHANVNLSEELKKICRVNTPDMKILVVDVLTGNDTVDQAKMFNDSVGVDALILTKADVYDKGGALLSATHTIQKPIIFLGIGQDYGDMEPYDPKTIIKRLLE
ncbi:MAG: signal recognition particle-docking protein FtsY, partial [Candidatus Aenigmarchaeota archaeon]|nr:signal recognition particle-docking protein FtsY [Candidatus Aenigmarchaeota archaeon]